MSFVLESLNRIHYKRVIWILAIAETLHNTEEAIWLPAWSQTAGIWHPSVTAFEFRFAVIAITLLFYGIIYYFSRRDTMFSKYLMGGALIMILFNVFMPHLLATVALAHYAPGVISGILFNLPVTLYLLRRGIREGFFSTRVLILGAIGVAVVVGPLLPAFFFRHPHVPDQFACAGDMHVFAGRYPDVVANSTALIGGIRTATVILNGPVDKETLHDLAAVVIHEGFHAFQFTTGRQITVRVGI